VTLASPAGIAAVSSSLTARNASAAATTNVSVAVSATSPVAIVLPIGPALSRYGNDSPPPVPGAAAPAPPPPSAASNASAVLAGLAAASAHGGNFTYALSNISTVSFNLTVLSNLSTSATASAVAAGVASALGVSGDNVTIVSVLASPPLPLPQSTASIPLAAPGLPSPPQASSEALGGDANSSSVAPVAAPGGGEAPAAVGPPPPPSNATSLSASSDTASAGGGGASESSNASTSSDSSLSAARQPFTNVTVLVSVAVPASDPALAAAGNASLPLPSLPGSSNLTSFVFASLAGAGADVAASNALQTSSLFYQTQQVITITTIHSSNATAAADFAVSARAAFAGPGDAGGGQRVTVNVSVSPPGPPPSRSAARRGGAAGGIAAVAAVALLF